LTAALKPYAGKEFVTYHDFAPYFAQRYNHSQIFWWTYLRRTHPGGCEEGDERGQRVSTQDAVDRATGSRQPIRGAGKDLNVQVSNFDPMETSGSEG